MPTVGKMSRPHRIAVRCGLRATGPTSQIWSHSARSRRIARYQPGNGHPPHKRTIARPDRHTRHFPWSPRPIRTGPHHPAHPPLGTGPQWTDRYGYRARYSA
jgi:hypothetical protein